MNVDELKQSLLKNDSVGAFVSFEGWVRNQNADKNVVALEYEAADSLCERETAEIINEAKAKFEVQEVLCCHRTGKVSVGEMSVWIGVTAVHRDAAFTACRFVVDELKRRVPIWKKEFYSDGTVVWLEGCNAQTGVPGTSRLTEANYYDRQIKMPWVGQHGQEKIKNARILVVGAGGLGCAALTSLAQMGVGTIGVCDHDVVAAENLHRQPLYRVADVGRLKAEIAAAQLEAINPFVKVNACAQKVDDKNIEGLAAPYLVLLDCTDNFEAKFLLHDYAYKNRKVLVHASIYQAEGQLRVFDFSREQKGPCLRCLWPEVPPSGPSDALSQPAVLGPVPNILGHWQALESLKWILDLPDQLQQHTLVFNVFTNEVVKIKNKRNPDCPLCAEQ